MSDITLEPVVDCHGHLITKGIYPREIFTGRFEVPQCLVNAMCEAVEEGEKMGLWWRLAWSVMPAKARRIEDLVKLFMGTLSEQARVLQTRALAAGVREVWVLGLDLPDIGEYGRVEERRSLVNQIAVLEKLPGMTNGLLQPFYPFDPRREGCVESLVKARQRGAFRGVKMYSALGFNVEGAVNPSMAWHANLRDAFEELERTGFPIVVHCSGGGVRGPEVHEGDMKWLSSPERWFPVLKKYPRLKVCFAHGTGESGFLSLVAPKPGSWADHLRELMLRFPGVYADMAFHTGMVNAQAKYKAGVSRLLETPLRRRLLFGSDVPLHAGDYSYKTLIDSARKSVPGLSTLLVSNAKDFLTGAV